jgi:multiple sugar transport system ATP-binding protein
MNLIDGELRQEGGNWIFEAPGLTLQVGSLRNAAQAGLATLGARPEHIGLGTGPLRGVVQVVEQTGHENIVTVKLTDEIRLIGRVPGTQHLRIGEAIALQIDGTAAHVFAPGAAGQRLNTDESTPEQRRAQGAR